MSSSLPKLVLAVEGMECGSDAVGIKKMVLVEPGVAAVTVSLTSQRVVIEHDPAVTTADALKEVVYDMGFDVEVLPATDAAAVEAEAAAAAVAAAATAPAGCAKGCCDDVAAGTTAPAQAATAPDDGGCATGCCDDAGTAAVNHAPAATAPAGDGGSPPASLVGHNPGADGVDGAVTEECGACAGEGTDCATSTCVDTARCVHQELVPGACCCGIPSARQDKTTTYRIQNLCCDQEAKLIEKLIRGMPGITKVSVSVIGKIAIVDHCRWSNCPDCCCDTPEKTLAVLNAAKLGASIRQSGAAHAVTFAAQGQPKLELAAVWLLVAGAALMLAADEPDWTRASEVLSLVALGLGGVRIAYRAAFELWHLAIGMDALVAIALAGCVILGWIGDREAWLDGAILVAIFLAIQQLEAWYSGRVARALTDVGVSAVSSTALLASGRTVDVEDIKAGDVLAVRAGDQVPVDGVVTKGSGALDESAVTGESVPLHKELGDQVLGGTVCQQGYFELRAEAEAAGSMLRQIVDLLERAQAEKTNSQTIIERFVRFYTPVVLLTALLYGVICGSTADDQSDCAQAALVVLILACPCALVAAAPTPLAFGTAAAVRSGAVIKSPQAFEDLASCKTVVFDKTGTLTEGNFEVIGTVWLGGEPGGEPAADRRRAVWDMVAAVQNQSTHPIATALVRHATGCVTEAFDEAEATGTHQPTVSGFRNIPGTGVAGTVTLDAAVAAKSIFLGNRKVLNEAAELGPAALDQLAAFEERSDGSTVVFVVVGGVVQLAVALSDTVRPGAHDAVSALHQSGVETMMLTGDREQSAKQVSAELGIAGHRSGLKPEDKLAWVEAAVARGRAVIMIGDGMNDGPSLAAATVGIAMGAGGTAMAVESATVVMLRDELQAVPYIMRLSHLCRRRIRQNIALAVTIKLVFVVLALTDTLAKLWVAVLVDAISILLVMANSRRGVRVLAHKKQGQEQQQQQQQQRTTSAV